MHKQSTPQTTQNGTARDAAVQIGGDGKALENKELFHVEREEGADLVATKSALLMRGLKNHCIELGFSSDSFALGYLGHLTAALTSPSKWDREHAKKEVRRLVKIGGGDAP